MSNIDFVKKEGYAPSAIFYPGLINRPDYTVFKQSKSDKDKKLTAKSNHKDELRRAYGSRWKRHLNVPEKKLLEPIHFSS